jgi:hypothetical protein
LWMATGWFISRMWSTSSQPTLLTRPHKLYLSG